MLQHYGISAILELQPLTSRLLHLSATVGPAPNDNFAKAAEIHKIHKRQAPDIAGSRNAKK